MMKTILAIFIGCLLYDCIKWTVKKLFFKSKVTVKEIQDVKTRLNRIENEI